MSNKSDRELREDIKAAEGFFRRTRGKRGSQLSAQERERILAAGRGHAERAESARRELAMRGPSARAAMRANESALERIAKRLPGRKRAELQAELDAEQELARLAKRAERDEQLRARHRKAEREAAERRKVHGVPVPTGWERDGGMQLAALFGSVTLWGFARHRGEAGAYPEVLDAADIAALYAIVGVMAETGSDVFLVPNGAPGRNLRLLRELPGWRGSVQNLVRVGLLAEFRHRDRVEYRVGPSAQRIIQAASEGRSIPFARIEDQEAAKLA